MDKEVVSGGGERMNEGCVCKCWRTRGDVTRGKEGKRSKKRERGRTRRRVGNSAGRRVGEREGGGEGYGALSVYDYILELTVRLTWGCCWA